MPLAMDTIETELKQKGFAFRPGAVLRARLGSIWADWPSLAASWDDLGEDRHVVAVEEAPAEAEDDKERRGDRQRAGVAHAEDRGDDQAHPDGAGVDPAPLARPHPAIDGNGARGDGHRRICVHHRKNC